MSELEKVARLLEAKVKELQAEVEGLTRTLTLTEGMLDHIKTSRIEDMRRAFCASREGVLTLEGFVGGTMTPKVIYKFSTFQDYEREPNKDTK